MNYHKNNTITLNYLQVSSKNHYESQNTFGKTLYKTKDTMDKQAAIILD